MLVIPIEKGAVAFITKQADAREKGQPFREEPESVSAFLGLSWMFAGSLRRWI